MTKLEKPLKREILIKDEAYVVTLTPTDLKITRKGHRNGVEVTWTELLGGAAAPAPETGASDNETRQPE